MVWLYVILLILWAIWMVVTNIGKIVTFLALVVCGIVAACFGLLAVECIVIGLARVLDFLHDYGRAVLWSVAAIVASLVAWCVWDSRKTKEQQKKNLKAMFARKDELIAGNPRYIEFFRGYDAEYQVWLSEHSND